MIDYQTYCQIRLFHQERGLTFSQIAIELGIDPETAAKYAALATYPRHQTHQQARRLQTRHHPLARTPPLQRHPDLSAPLLR